MHSTTLRNLLLASAIGTGLFSAHAQEGKVRVKVKADLAAAPDRELGMAKAVYGDAGSFVALKTLGGKRVLGGLADKDLGWQLCVIASDKMNEIKHDQPKFVWGIGPVSLETIEHFNNQFRAILTKPDPENGQLLLMEQVLNPRSLTGRAASAIAELPYDLFGKGGEYFKPGTSTGFTTTVSGKGNYMLIGLSPASTTRAAGAPIVGVMVNGAMKPVWAKALAQEAGNARTEVVATAADNNGAAWYLIKNVTDAAPAAKDAVGYSYCLYRMDSTGQKAYPLDLGKKDYVQEAAVAFLPDGKIACVGTYSTAEAARNESVGIFHTMLNLADGKWTPSKRTPFNMKEVKKVQRLQTNMHLEHAWPKGDGSVYVVAERAGIESHLVSDLSGKKVEKTEWVNGNFHVMELGGDGNLKWYTEVPREMSFANDGPGKAFSIAYSDVLYLFYNDAKANIELRKKKQPVDPIDKPKDALMLEFAAGGAYKESVVLQDGPKQGYFDADAVWPLGNGLQALEGAPDFRKDRTFPVLIEMGDQARR